MNKVTSYSSYDSIDTWLNQWTPTLPWRPVKSPRDAKDLEALLRAESVGLQSLQAAMLWIRIGDIDRSHSIVQEDSSSLGSYLHGIVHRIEGDYWNSNYWMQRVRDSGLVSSVSESVIDQLTALGSLPLAIEALIVHDHQFRAAALVSACERASKLEIQSGAMELLETVGYAEWQALWKRIR